MTQHAPERDYMKVANSITRTAVPSGFFGENGGKSKQLYDYLYSQTRGAVMPRRTVRISKERLMKGADIGSGVTLRNNLKRLCAVGLVEETIVPGTHGGNQYEVFLPEEVGLGGSTPSSPSSTTTGSSSTQILEALEALDSRASSTSLSPTTTIVSEEPKTFIKDVRTNDDDEAFAGFVELVSEAATELTGKVPSKVEAERWRELAELLVMELKIAAARTGSVSSVPAFLTEHLRRRLWKTDKHREPDRESLESDSGSDGPRRLSAEQVKSCPDCGGTSYWYPEGYERGVARCRHEKLTSEGPQ